MMDVKMVMLGVVKKAALCVIMVLLAAPPILELETAPLVPLDFTVQRKVLLIAVHVMLVNTKTRLAKTAVSCALQGHSTLELVMPLLVLRALASM
jgi:hypothetical protein